LQNDPTNRTCRSHHGHCFKHKLFLFRQFGQMK
jgi:hypothetical protein